MLDLSETSLSTWHAELKACGYRKACLHEFTDLIVGIDAMKGGGGGWKTRTGQRKYSFHGPTAFNRHEMNGIG